jgi:hypothetical protein
MYSLNTLVGLALQYGFLLQCKPIIMALSNHINAVLAISALSRDALITSTLASHGEWLEPLS